MSAVTEESFPELRRFGRSVNFVLLVTGFGIGQGSLFVAQTWLVHAGQLAFLGRFGALWAFAMLAILVVDLNALTSLARGVAATVGMTDRAAASWHAYAAVTVVRIGAALAVTAIALVYAALDDDAFSRGYIVAALPGVLVWACNGAGMLDGLQRSGISGIAYGLPYVATAATLPFASSLSPATAGAALGGAFAIGFVAAVALHMAALARFGFAFRYRRPTRSSVRAAAREGLTMTAQWLPGQAFYRIEILLCAYLFGGATTGLFVYAKQITNAASQTASFLRRVEFPALVRQLERTPKHRIGTTLLRMRGAIIGAAVAAAGVAAFALSVGPLLGERLAHAAGIVSMFSPVVFTGALSATLTLGLFALGRSGQAARIANISLACGVLLLAALAPLLRLAGFVGAEILMQLVAIQLTTLTFGKEPPANESLSET